MCEFFGLQMVCYCPAGESCMFANASYSHIAHGRFFHYGEITKVGKACEPRKRQLGRSVPASRTCPHSRVDNSDPANDRTINDDLEQVCKVCEFRCTGTGVPKTRTEDKDKSGKKYSNHRTSKARYIRK